MEELEKLNNRVKEIDAQLSGLNAERMALISTITDITWKSIPVCEHSYYAIRSGMCNHGEVHNGNIYCKHRFCGK